MNNHFQLLVEATIERQQQLQQAAQREHLYWVGQPPTHWPQVLLWLGAIAGITLVAVL